MKKQKKTNDNTNIKFASSTYVWDWQFRSNIDMFQEVFFDCRCEHSTGMMKFRLPQNQVLTNTGIIVQQTSLNHSSVGI